MLCNSSVVRGLFLSKILTSLVNVIFILILGNKYSTLFIVCLLFKVFKYHICQIGIFLIAIAYCSWFRIFKENWDSFGMVRQSEFAFFFHGTLLFYTCLHSYIFAMRHINSVLNLKFFFLGGGHSNFRTTVIYAHQKIWGLVAEMIPGLPAHLNALWKLLLSCITKLTRTLFAQISHYPRRINRKKYLLKERKVQCLNLN